MKKKKCYKVNIEAELGMHGSDYYVKANSKEEAESYIEGYFDDDFLERCLDYIETSYEAEEISEEDALEDLEYEYEKELEEA